MTVKLEVIIYTNEKGMTLTQITGSYSKDVTSEREFQVATGLHDVIKDALRNDYNGVNIFSENVAPCAHNAR
ncbi:hypothetical protein EGX65_03610 [Escherichia coli]|uniref:Uncharacterized protein n=1 Tax=Escherichia coli TaxID=562 RepID=A0A168T6T6_ECOLX|nr:hypothetical protein [Escherichia coli]EEW5971676.1 hypothetical protein [Escherichia coli]EFA9199957.1 hypothetical protein [Escherichia coli]EFB9698140.1 hypothetical protein [Escherichia coli]EFB9702391.1 hypothetical protein [Escherichia coli]EFC2247453.1 hypothetical protein [Escherichia coli]